jgi:hypothetical protein
MSFGAKIAIVIVVGFLLSAVGAVGLVAFLWSRHSGELLEAGRKQTDQGSAFGSQTDEAGCLAEAIRRYKANRGFAGSMAANMFVQACWPSSQPTPGFCDHVPKPLDVLAGSRWQVEQAKKAGLDDPVGGSVFAQLRAYCDAKRQRAH